MTVLNTPSTSPEPDRELLPHLGLCAFLEDHQRPLIEQRPGAGLDARQRDRLLQNHVPRDVHERAGAHAGVVERHEHVVVRDQRPQMTLDQLLMLGVVERSNDHPLR